MNTSTLLLKSLPQSVPRSSPSAPSSDSLSYVATPHSTTSSCPSTKPSTQRRCFSLPSSFLLSLARRRPWSNSEPLFHLFGFLVCGSSTTCHTLKFVVQGILLTLEANKLHSMNLLLYMALVAMLILLPFSLYIEGNVLALTIEKVSFLWFYWHQSILSILMYGMVIISFSC
ncbi:sugar phosphate/phosphate translocator [Spatholobus suberectus]|nr:sugar phosphate/phosphate translocator [Spatholobus suberectus]